MEIVYCICGRDHVSKTLLVLSTLFLDGNVLLTLPSASGLLASIARLAYQIPEADQPNKTMIVMVLLLLKYVSTLETLTNP